MVTDVEDMEPDISYFQYYFDAYRELGSCRQIGMGIGAIPFTAIVEYFTIFPIGESFEDFHWLMRKLDDTFLKLYYDKQKKESGEGKKNSGKSNTSKRNTNRN